jgi:hypothetical protein
MKETARGIVTSTYAECRDRPDSTRGKIGMVQGS